MRLITFRARIYNVDIRSQTLEVMMSDQAACSINGCPRTVTAKACARNKGVKIINPERMMCMFHLELAIRHRLRIDQEQEKARNRVEAKACKIRQAEEKKKKPRIPGSQISRNRAARVFGMTTPFFTKHLAGAEREKKILTVHITKRDTTWLYGIERSDILNFLDQIESDPTPFKDNLSENAYNTITSVEWMEMVRTNIRSRWRA